MYTIKAIIIFLSFVFHPMIGFCQIDTLVGTTIKTKKNINEYFIYKDSTVSYRYPCSDTSCANIHVEQSRDGFILKELDINKKVICRSEMIVVLDSVIMMFVGDKISKKSANRSILGSDSTFPSTIIVYNLKLINHGRSVLYDSLGRVKMVGQWRNGYKSGIWKYFSHDGRIIKKEKYKWKKRDNMPIWYNSGDGKQLKSSYQ